jgi:hypothetical protein
VIKIHSCRARGRSFARVLLAGCGYAAIMTGSAAAQTPVALSTAPSRAPGSVSGTVSQANGEYLDGASVAIPALDRATAADRSGRFTISDLPAGTYEIVIRYVGFPDQRRTITVVGEPVTLDVRFDAVPEAGSTADASDIVVNGGRPIAESEAAALQIQRTSPSLVSVVASDSVGRLPDQNIAQAVSRLPGVAVQRDQGQARYINLRGAPINWTTLSFDGINVVSPEGRDARFDSIPSAIASQIIVRKAVTPDMTGETIAGNVDIITGRQDRI